MRSYLLSGIAVVVSSAVAFFAGAHSGLSLSAQAETACPPAAEAAPAAQGEEAASEQPAADAEPAKEPKVEPGDEDQWPYEKWLSGEEEPGDRVYSKVRFLWIRPEPKEVSTFLGYLSLGDSVRVKGGKKDEAVAGKSRSLHCDTWYEVEPRGYVCLDDEQEEATFDAADPVLAQLRERKADRMSPWPYDYAESVGTPIYDIIPPKHRQRRNESVLEEHLKNVRLARRAKSDEEIMAIDERLLGVDVQLTGNEPPPFPSLGPRARTTKSKVVRGSTIAFTDSFDADGRSWIMTWDKGIIPRDKIKPYPKSDFHGVAVTDEVRLPIAFFRREQPKYRLGDDGKVTETKDLWARQSWVPVTEESVDYEGKRYIVSRQDGLLLSVDGVSVARRSHYIPPQIEEVEEGRRTWVDVSVLGGWLVAYEYDKPVYATLVSPGRGGVPKHGVDPLETASTPVGRFRITGKFVTATMVSNASKDIIHDEVMYTQNFTGPYALHGAYWHGDWGEKKSGGCVNLSPTDARRLFAWTEPQLPPGWHSVQLVTGYENALAEYQRATLVYVHK